LLFVDEKWRDWLLLKLVQKLSDYKLE